MQTAPDFGHREIVMELIRGVLDVVADQPSLTPERRVNLQQAVASSLMAYNPRDPLETMLAGQCMVYDAMIRDGARDLLNGQSDSVKIRMRPGILAAGKLFLATTEMILRMQGRPVDQLAFSRGDAKQATTGQPTAEALADPPPVPAEAKPTPAPPSTAAPATSGIARPAAPRPAVNDSRVGTRPDANRPIPPGPEPPAITTRPGGDAAPKSPPGPPGPTGVIDERLLAGMDPEDQRDLREAYALAVRLAGIPEPRAGADLSR